VALLEIALLGPGSYRTTWSDRSHDMANASGQLLARLLLSRGRPIRREAIAAELWNDFDPSGARRRLNTALYRLRKQIEPNSNRPSFVISTSATELLFDVTQDYWLDVEDFERIVERCLSPRPLGAADVEMFTSGLDRYESSLCEALDGEWLAPERRRLANLHVQAMSVLGTRHLQDNNPNEALRLAQRAMRLEPLREDLHRLVIRALAATGDRSGALMAFETCKRMLADELDINPLPETTRLAAAIGRGVPDSYVNVTVGNAIDRLNQTRSELVGLISDIDRAIHTLND